MAAAVGSGLLLDESRLPVNGTAHNSPRAIFIGLSVLSGLALMVLPWIVWSQHVLVRAGGVLLASIAGGLWLSRHWGPAEGLTGVTWVICSTGVITFIAILVAESDSERRITKRKMRDAIAGSFVMTYLVSFGLAAFYLDPREELTGISNTLVISFTTLMATVVGFYFHATAKEKVAEIQALPQLAGKPSTQKAAEQLSTVAER
jgi:hypothetical protein